MAKYRPREHRRLPARSPNRTISRGPSTTAITTATSVRRTPSVRAWFIARLAAASSPPPIIRETRAVAAIDTAANKPVRNHSR